MGNTISEELYLNVMEFCDWDDRRTCRSLSRKFASMTTTNSYYHWCCQRLACDHLLYFSEELRTHEWKAVFKELYPLRFMWKPAKIPSLSATIVDDITTTSTSSVLASNSDKYRGIDDGSGTDHLKATAQPSKFKINVYARFRPSAHTLKSHATKPSASTTLSQEKVTEKDDKVGESTTESTVEVNLPLYQRLAMIKMSHKLKSNREALKVLASEGGWFHKKWSTVNRCNDDNRIVDENEDPANIPKFRENMEKEKTFASVQSVDTATSRVVMIAPDVGLREFVFDGVLSQTASQASLYELTSRRLIMDFMNGYNATTVVYGQTGTGKSYSMFGDSDASIYGLSDRQRGLVPRACAEILKAVEDRARLGIQSRLAVTYVEIFGDFVSDLLRSGVRVGHSQVASQRYVLSGAAEYPIQTMDDVAHVLRVGEAQKRRAATAMNDRSSRAHVLFILSLTQTREAPITGMEGISQALPSGAAPRPITRTSRLFLADLGGSEQVKKSQVEVGGMRRGLDDPFSAGFEMVIEALNNKSSHVPYHDSKLTMLLSDGLGGDCKTSIVVCASMDPEHSSETMSSLRFGERCALIETEARNNANMLAAVLAELDSRIKDLEAAIKTKEKWELREEKRTDELAEAGTFEAAIGGVEIKKVYFPVGAELERVQLEKLLRQRAKFTGSVFDPADEPAVDDGASAGAVAVARSSRSQKAKRVVGFGAKFAEMYGIGEGYDMNTEFTSTNDRFEDEVKEEFLPDLIRSKKVRGAKPWLSASQLNSVDPKKLAERAKKVNRTRLNYAGMSAGGGF